MLTPVLIKASCSLLCIVPALSTFGKSVEFCFNFKLFSVLSVEVSYIFPLFERSFDVWWTGAFQRATEEAYSWFLIVNFTRRTWFFPSYASDSDHYSLVHNRGCPQRDSRVFFDYLFHNLFSSLSVGEAESNFQLTFSHFLLIRAHNCFVPNVLLQGIAWAKNENEMD